MTVITATNELESYDDYITCFLAGGITNCGNWQKIVIDTLNEFDGAEKLLIFNPRRENFPIDKPEESRKQIEWEYDHIGISNIFSMYFDYSDKSDQPICFYELGRANALYAIIVAAAESKYLKPYGLDPNEILEHRSLIISTRPNFKRTMDVIIQTELAFNFINSQKLAEKHVLNPDISPEEHAALIYNEYRRILNNDTK